jgi:hypothetical protein
MAKTSKICKYHIHIVTRKRKYLREALTTKVVSRGLIETAGSSFGDFRMDYLDECEAICETALARQSGPWEGLIDEKIRGSEISTTLMHCLYFISQLRFYKYGTSHTSCSI